MDKSLRKWIAVNELNYILQSNNVPESERARLIPALFENPQTETRYLLKNNVRTLSELEKTVRNVVSKIDFILAIVNCFSVKDDLPIPSELKAKLLSNQKFAFFVGAGISKLLGIPLWDELADYAADYLENRGYINHAESSSLRNEKYTAKQKISIFHRIVNDRDEIKNFYEKHLNPPDNDNNNGNPYELLFRLEQALAKPIVKISTNIDLEWERILKAKSDKQKARDEQGQDGQLSRDQIYYTNTQYDGFTAKQQISDKILYQIHGSLGDLTNATLTMRDYVHNYSDESGLKGFLQKVFMECVVLFMGSSVQEFEILEHCIKDSPLEHYALIGRETDEENLFRMKKAYFSDMKIKALPYYTDYQGHDRLLLVLKYWADEIASARKKQFYEDIQLIDEVL